MLSQLHIGAMHQLSEAASLSTVNGQVKRQLTKTSLNLSFTFSTHNCKATKLHGTQMFHLPEYFVPARAGASYEKFNLQYPERKCANIKILLSLLRLSQKSMDDLKKRCAHHYHIKFCSHARSVHFFDHEICCYCTAPGSAIHENIQKNKRISFFLPEIIRKFHHWYSNKIMIVVVRMPYPGWNRPQSSKSFWTYGCRMCAFRVCLLDKNLTKFFYVNRTSVKNVALGRYVK